jgi:Tfp pilus assembly protein FimV
MFNHHYRAPSAAICGFLLCLLATGQVRSAQPPGSYKPKPGQTLDQVIAQTMGKSPLSLAVLRQAFIQKNPVAFESGKTPKLRKGVVLIVPDHDALLLSLMPSPPPEPRPATVSIAVTSEPEASSPLTPVVGEDRRRWVRYP